MEMAVDGTKRTGVGRIACLVCKLRLPSGSVEREVLPLLVILCFLHPIDAENVCACCCYSGVHSVLPPDVLSPVQRSSP